MGLLRDTEIQCACMFFVMMEICFGRCCLPLTFFNLHKSTALRRCILQTHASPEVVPLWYFIIYSVHASVLKGFKGCSAQKFKFSHHLLVLMPSQMYDRCLQLNTKIFWLFFPYNASVLDPQSWCFKNHTRKHNGNTYDPRWCISFFRGGLSSSVFIWRKLF